MVRRQNNVIDADMSVVCYQIQNRVEKIWVNASVQGSWTKTSLCEAAWGTSLLPVFSMDLLNEIFKVIIHFVKEYNAQNCLIWLSTSKKKLPNKVGTIAEVFWSLKIEEGTAFPLEGLVAANGYELTVTLDILT